MAKNKIWIWEDDNYPNFTYAKNQVNPLLLDVANQKGMLEGTIKHLSQDAQHKVFTESILDEIIYNFSIEGEILQRSSVRSSLRKQFDKFDDKLANKHTDNIVSIQHDVN